MLSSGTAELARSGKRPRKGRAACPGSRGRMAMLLLPAPMNACITRLPAHLNERLCGDVILLIAQKEQQAIKDAIHIWHLHRGQPGAAG